MLVCVFCDNLVDGLICQTCNDYKGIVTISEWEDYVGESWPA